MRLNRIFERFEDERRMEDEERSGRRQKARQHGPGLGFARRNDIHDPRSQAQAPGGGGRTYDRTGEKRYEHGLDRFEHGDHDAPRGPGYGGGARSGWELDEGGVQFGAPAASHAGRGPRGYRRSDERIREDVCDLFTEAHDLNAEDVEVAVADAVVTLTGSVDNRAARRRAEDSALLVPGVADVHNQLRARGDERGAVRLF